MDIFDGKILIKTKDFLFKVSKEVVRHNLEKVKEEIDKNPKTKIIEVNLNKRQLYLLLIFISMLLSPNNKQDWLDLWIACNEMKLVRKYKQILYTDSLRYLDDNKIQYYPAMKYEEVFYKIRDN